MKKKSFVSFFCLISLCVLVFSCKSTPEAAEETGSEPPAASFSTIPQEQPVDYASLDRAIARAEEARQRALDFEAPSYFPSDWENAEAGYAAAGTQPRTTADEVVRAASLYNAAADVYDDLFRKTVPLFAQDREDEIVTVRDRVIATGLTGTYPEYFAMADNKAVEAWNRYEAEEYYPARDSAVTALQMYQSLAAAAEAWFKRQEIVNNDFYTYDPENFDRADAVGLAAISDYEEGNISQALDEAEEAALRYGLALNTAWEAHAGDRRQSAGRERQNALNAKANVAVKDGYDGASRVYSEAESFYQTGNFREAAGLYDQSVILFGRAAQTAAEKRRVAEDAIRAAEEKMAESDETAKNAELVLEGGAQ
jgi:tetratricopeptide (TPR) repeat protein